MKRNHDEVCRFIVASSFTTRMYHIFGALNTAFFGDQNLDFKPLEKRYLVRTVPNEPKDEYLENMASDYIMNEEQLLQALLFP